MQAHRMVTQIVKPHLSMDLPAEFAHQRVEVIVLALESEMHSRSPHRQPHPSIAGQMHITGDIFSSVPEGAWELLR